jgi:hypothetical protein
MGKKSNKQKVVAPETETDEVDSEVVSEEHIHKNAWADETDNTDSIDDAQIPDVDIPDVDMDDESDQEYEEDFEHSNLDEILGTYFCDDKNRNLVDVAVEIKRCFEKQNVLLKKLVEHLLNK